MTPWYRRWLYILYVERPFPWLLLTIGLVTFAVTVATVIVVGRLVFT